MGVLGDIGTCGFRNLNRFTLQLKRDMGPIDANSVSLRK